MTKNIPFFGGGGGRGRVTDPPAPALATALELSSLEKIKIAYTRENAGHSVQLICQLELL